MSISDHLASTGRESYTILRKDGLDSGVGYGAYFDALARLQFAITPDPARVGSQKEGTPV